ncbi:uncharacterized protein BDZ99DRAFT_63030 [Mytilinidion resinicola]|uniref:Uncharacterized protein n=1 Tax=Mytilinidion resinicola TaxID=574789 RepID=A0A6A6YIF9_9PEZI|nr:uncharacterized protein BDZ99DRAFT_63030 [Mytilinidion resinicola]KAF2807707.1 hypothetical protein BDZ99DRAFT_63030 [Mytilinidion resinicola]
MKSHEDHSKRKECSSDTTAIEDNACSYEQLTALRCETEQPNPACRNMKPCSATHLLLRFKFSVSRKLNCCFNLFWRELGNPFDRPVVDIKTNSGTVGYLHTILVMHTSHSYFITQLLEKTSSEYPLNPFHLRKDSPYLLPTKKHLTSDSNPSPSVPLTTPTCS